MLVTGTDVVRWAAIINGLERAADKALADEPACAPEHIAGGLAALILDNQFGRKWTERHFLGSKKGPLHIDYEAHEKADEAQKHIAFVKLLRQHAVMERLAETILNLQNVPGIQTRFDALKRQKAPVMSIIAELDAARICVRSGLPFAFVQESGTKRKDFEGYTLHSSGTRICCEAKLKMPTTELSVKTINSTLNDARRQLPDAPSMVFIFIPDEWTGDHVALAEICLDATVEFFKSSKRVVGVNFSWFEFQVDPSTQYFWRYQGVTFQNITSRHWSPAFKGMFDRLSLQENPNWTTLREIAESAFKRRRHVQLVQAVWDR